MLGGSNVTCTCKDLSFAELWLASALDVSQRMRLVSDILQDTLAGLQRTGMPAFICQDLPDLCFTVLEALHSNATFQGCLTKGLSCSLSRSDSSYNCRIRTFYICVHPLARAEAKKTWQFMHCFFPVHQQLSNDVCDEASGSSECFLFSRVHCYLQPTLRVPGV